MILSLALLLHLAAVCGAPVHPETLAAIAEAESGRHPLAIADNTAGTAHRPATLDEALAVTRALLAGGHALDLGLMQINSAMLTPLGLAPADAFDPCRSLAAGARLLAEGYRPEPGEGGQAALDRALSRYNTGSPSRGLANGYVVRVRDAARRLVPAIAAVQTGPGRAADPAPDGPAAVGRQTPPSWDVYALARTARQAAPRPADAGGPPLAAAPTTLLPSSAPRSAVTPARP